MQLVRRSVWIILVAFALVLSGCAGEEGVDEEGEGVEQVIPGGGEEGDGEEGDNEEDEE